MEIVCLDGYTLNPGDLSWDRIANLGNLVMHDYTVSELIIERAGKAEILLTNKTPLSSETLSQLPFLRYIGVLATGYNVVDIKTAVEQGITVTNIPTYGTNSVAQHAFSLLLEICGHVQAHSDAVKAGEWSRSRDFCFWKYPMIELADKTMGIIGLGQIGRQVSTIASAMGMNVLAYDVVKNTPPPLQSFEWVQIPELLKRSDVVSLHCPLFPETRGIINTENLALMKESAFLINTSRGQLVVDQDLADALNSNVIAGAAVDVLSSEPPKTDSPLLSAKNIIITPHIAWATKEARSRLMEVVADNLNAFLAGNPTNVVSQP